MLLSDAKIRHSKPKVKTFKIKDGEGLFLVIRPNGSRHWQLRYRYLDKEKTLSLGKYPQVSLTEARYQKVEALRLVQAGKDPSIMRQQEKTLAVYHDRNSFGGITQEWLQRNRTIWSRKYGEKVECRLNKHILPRLGKRPISEILPLELLSVIQDIETKGKTHMAHLCLQICGRIFNYAIITGRAQQNISIGLSTALQPHREEHFPIIPTRELPEFLLALNRLQTSEQNKLAFQFLLHTAVRTGEMRFGRWADVDLTSRIWRIPAETTKMRTEHLVPLSRQSRQILIRLREISGHSEWLFPNQKRQIHPVMSENTINQMIKRMGYKGRIVGHGFRSLFSTILNENGFNRDAIERQLAHMERNAIRAAYNRAEYLDDRIELMQWWGDFIEQQCPRLFQNIGDLDRSDSASPEKTRSPGDFTQPLAEKPEVSDNFPYRLSLLTAPHRITTNITLTFE